MAGFSPKIHGVPATFQALRHRNFALFWSAQCVSLVGQWVDTTCKGWLALELTDSPFLLGLMNAVECLPYLLLSLFSGVLIDRVRKRNLIMMTQGALIVPALALAALTYFGLVRYWHLLLSAFVLGVAGSLDMPARQAFVIEITSSEDLLNAIALNSAIFNLARIVGPALAGILIRQVGYPVCFLTRAVSILGVITSLALMRVGAPVGRRIAQGFLSELIDGLRYVWGRRPMRTVLTIVGVMSLFVINFNTLIPTFAKAVLHQDALGYGFLNSSMGLGAFLGAIIMATYAPRWRGGTNQVFIGATLLPFFLIVLGLTRHTIASMVAIAFVGCSMILFGTTANTTVQLACPDYLRGRVMSVYMLLSIGPTSAGSLLSGWLVAKTGASIAFAVLGSIALCIVLLIWTNQVKQSRVPEEGFGKPMV